MSTTGKIPSSDSMDNGEWGQYDVEGDSEHGESPMQPILKPISSSDTQDMEKADGEDGVSEADRVKSSCSPDSELRRGSSGTGSGSFTAKQIALVVGQQSLSNGITSSPSFQELERAIGAQLALGLNSDSTQSLEGLGKSGAAGKIGLLRSKNSQNQLRSSPNSPRRNLSNSSGGSLSAYALGASARIELTPFINESESRALILLHSPSTNAAVIKDACQKYGVLYYLRPEFQSRGATFLSYFDHRAAIQAQKNLAEQLGPSVAASCYFSVMLHAANNCDESKLILRKLPMGFPDSEVETVLSRYGQLLSIQRTFDGEGDNQFVNYVVEFFNIQDAKVAASELSATSTQSYGPDTEISFATLDSRKQQLCRQLLSVLSRWRTDAAVMPPPLLSPYSSHGQVTHPHHMSGKSGNHPYTMMMQQTMGQFPVHPGMLMMPGMGGPPMPGMSGIPGMYYPDGSYGLYSQIPYAEPTFMYNAAAAPFVYDPQPQMAVPQKQQAIYYNDPLGVSAGSRPHHHNGGHANPSPSPQKKAHATRQHSVSDADLDFSLNIQKLMEGTEKRTTLMIRNIPNKYTQTSVLEEINANYNGLYDFFYLPIDFKNRCNVGYAFINFIDPVEIINFYHEFNGHKWRNFNSEKVCKLTFARIQGKQAMIARFQNSSLLEKDDAYKPLLFVSSGPDKGKPEQFVSRGGGKVGEGAADFSLVGEGDDI